MSESEIAEIAKAVGMEDDLDGFERKFTRRIGARVSLVEYSDGDCIFLEPETRRCSVYESRPSQCRTWPFWESNIATPRDWKEISKNCPGCNRGRLYSIEEIRKVIDGEQQAEKAFDGPDCGA
ncbi:YkgJ family cysteine cluster protein [Pirellulaceae bacterium SH467]